MTVAQKTSHIRVKKETRDIINKLSQGETVQDYLETVVNSIVAGHPPVQKNLDELLTLGDVKLAVDQLRKSQEDQYLDLKNEVTENRKYLNRAMSAIDRLGDRVLCLECGSNYEKEYDEYQQYCWDAMRENPEFVKWENKETKSIYRTVPNKFMVYKPFNLWLWHKYGKDEESDND